MRFPILCVRPTSAALINSRLRLSFVSLLWLLTLLSTVPACAQWSVSFQCSGTTQSAYANQPWNNDAGSAAASNSISFGSPYLGPAQGPVSTDGTVTPVFTWTGGGTPPDHVYVLLRPYAEAASGTNGTSLPKVFDGFFDPLAFYGNGQGAIYYSQGSHVVNQPNPHNLAVVTLDPVSLDASATGDGPPYPVDIVGLNASVDTGPDFAIDDTSCTVGTGSQGRSYTNITPINGFSGPVSVSFSGMPQGIRVRLETGNPYAVGGSSPTFVGIVVHADLYVDPGSYKVGIVGTGTVGGQSVTRNATLTVVVVPVLADGGVPPYGGGSEPGDGVGDDPVNLATGTDVYHQPTDLVAYNPNGPPAAFTRTAYSNLARQGYGSPGLSPGWVHNYDIQITGPATAGTWGALTLNHLNGAQEALTPVLSGGSPTGAFTTVPGAPYSVSGVPSTTTGQWQYITVTWTDQSQWLFAPVGDAYAPIRILPRTGHALTLAWNSSRALTSVSDTTSGTALLTLVYDSSGYLHTLTDCYGRVVTYTFGMDSSTYCMSLLNVSQVSSTAVRESYAYVSGYGWPLLATVSVPSPTGSGTSSGHVAYDGQYRVSSFTDANNIQHTYTYNSGSTLVQVGPVGATSPTQAWTVHYDAQGRDTGTTNASGYSTQIAYGDAANPYRPTQTTDRNGHSETMTYDAYGHVVTHTDRRGTQTTYTWDYTAFPLGLLTSVQAGTNQSTPRTPVGFAYDIYNNVRAVTQAAPGSGPGGATVTATYTYDALGNVLTVKTPGNDATIVGGVNQGITTTYNYTSDGSYAQAAAVGEPLTATDSLGHVTHFRYTARGRLQSVVDALGHETDFGYNDADQPQSATYPATGQTGSGHSTAAWSYLYLGGPLMGETAGDEGGRVVRQVVYGRGAEGELLSLTGSTEPASYAYDALYRKVSQTTGGHTTHYYYNADGYVAAMTYPGYAGSAWPYISGPDSRRFTSFDNNGNPQARVDGDGTAESLTYAPDDRLTGVHYAHGTGVTAVGDTTLAYDAYGRPQSMSDDSGTHTYVFDDADLLTSDVTTYTGLPALTVSYGYNPDGSRATMGTPAGSFSYAYDAAGRPASLTNPFGEQTQWGFLDNGWLSAQQTGLAGVLNPTLYTTSYTRDALGRPTDLANGVATHPVSPGSPASEYSGLTYDGVGDLTGLTAGVTGAPAAYSGTTAFGYDAGQTVGRLLGRGQLTQESSTRGGGYTSGFGYDGGSRTGPGNPTTFRGASRSFNGDDQDTSDTFDGAGSPTTYGGTAMTYAPDGRATVFGSVLTAGYRGDGLRAWKQTQLQAVVLHNGGHTNDPIFDPDPIQASIYGLAYYIYDGSLPVCEVDSGGSVTATNTFGADGLVSRHTGGGTTFYAFDPQGSVSQRLDGSGAATSSDLYDAFGMVTSTASSVPDPWGFGAKWGGYTDAETGLVLLGRRYYDPARGRFLTRDPLGYAGGRDLYAYCRNNPASLADPSGLCPDGGDGASMGGELHGNYRRNHVSQQIDQTEMMLVGAALGAFGGGELDLIGGEVGAGVGNAFEGVGPWAEGLEMTKGGAVAQSLPGSCVSATGEMLSGGSMTEGQFLEQLGEWSNASDLADVLNSLEGSGTWQGGFFSEAQAVAAAQGGQIGAVLQAPFLPAHMVVIEPAEGGMFLVRDPAIGGTYPVTLQWIRQYVTGGVFR